MKDFLFQSKLVKYFFIFPLTVLNFVRLHIISMILRRDGVNTNFTLQSYRGKQKFFNSLSVEEVAGGPDHCLVSCEGLYADIQHLPGQNTSDTSQQLISIVRSYNLLKEKVAKSMIFDSPSASFSK